MRMKRKVQPSSVLTFLLFLLLCIIILFPLLCLLLGAFKPSSYIIRFGLNAKIEPEIMSLDNFRTLFSGGNDYVFGREILASNPLVYDDYRTKLF